MTVLHIFHAFSRGKTPWFSTVFPFFSFPSAYIYRRGWKNLIFGAAKRGWETVQCTVSDVAESDTNQSIRASCKTSSCFRYWEVRSLGDLEKTSKNLRNSKTPFLPAAKANTDLMEPRGFASASANCGSMQPGRTRAQP